MTTKYTPTLTRSNQRRGRFFPLKSAAGTFLPAETDRRDPPPVEKKPKKDTASCNIEAVFFVLIKEGYRSAQRSAVLYENAKRSHREISIGFRNGFCM